MAYDKQTVYNASGVYKEAGGGGGGGEIPQGYERYFIIRNKISITGIENGIRIDKNGVLNDTYTYGVSFVNKLLEHNYNQVAHLFKTKDVNETPFSGIYLDDTSIKFSNGGVVGTTSNNLNKSLISLGVKNNRIYNLITNTTIGGTVNFVSANYRTINLLGNFDGSKNVPLNAEELYNFFILNSNGDKIMDLVPCKRLDDNYIGVFDIVSKNFYPANNQSNYEVI